MNLVVGKEGETEDEQRVKKSIMMLIHINMIPIRSKKMRKACQ